jgi:hypothetical protein
VPAATGRHSRARRPAACPTAAWTWTMAAAASPRRS